MDENPTCLVIRIIFRKNLTFLFPFRVVLVTTSFFVWKIVLRFHLVEINVKLLLWDIFPQNIGSFASFFVIYFVEGNPRDCLFFKIWYINKHKTKTFLHLGCPFCGHLFFYVRVLQYKKRALSCTEKRQDSALQFKYHRKEWFFKFTLKYKDELHKHTKIFTKNKPKKKKKNSWILT